MKRIPSKYLFKDRTMNLESMAVTHPLSFKTIAKQAIWKNLFTDTERNFPLGRFLVNLIDLKHFKRSSLS